MLIGSARFLIHYNEGGVKVWDFFWNCLLLDFWFDVRLPLFRTFYCQKSVHSMQAGLGVKAADTV